MDLSDTANVNGRCCFADGYNHAHCFYLIALCFLFCSGVTLGKQLQLKKHRILSSVPVCDDLSTLITDRTTRDMRTFSGTDRGQTGINDDE